MKILGAGLAILMALALQTTLAGLVIRGTAAIDLVLIVGMLGAARAIRRVLEEQLRARGYNLVRGYFILSQYIGKHSKGMVNIVSEMRVT